MTLFGRFLASCFLKIKSLMELTGEALTAMIREKSAAEMWKSFNIESVFSLGGEEVLRKPREVLNIRGGRGRSN